MIPEEISGLENIPRKGYKLVEEDGSVAIYLIGKFVAEISVANLLELFKTTAFSKGIAFSNLLIFIRNDFKKYE